MPGRNGGMLQICFHVMVRWRVSTQVVHRSCWSCCTDFMTLSFSTSFLLSWSVSAGFTAGLLETNSLYDSIQHRDGRPGYDPSFSRRTMHSGHWTFCLILAVAWLCALWDLPAEARYQSSPDPLLPLWRRQLAGPIGKWSVDNLPQAFRWLFCEIGWRGCNLRESRYTFFFRTTKRKGQERVDERKF